MKLQFTKEYVNKIILNCKISKKKSKLESEIKIAILKKAARIQIEDTKKYKKDKKYKKKIGEVNGKIQANKTNRKILKF